MFVSMNFSLFLSSLINIKSVQVISNDTNTLFNLIVKTVSRSIYLFCHQIVIVDLIKITCLKKWLNNQKLETSQEF